MNKIDWTKYFDAIWCVNYKPHKVRYELIKKEFERIGILDHPNFKFHETFPSIYDKYFYNKLLADRLINPAFILSEKNINAAMGHYACIKKSLLDNYEHILIIEDDIRFLKDLDMIKNILDNIPSDYDIILYDYFMHCSEKEFENYKKTQTNQYYYHYNNLSSVGCYALSKKALQLFEKLYEKIIFPPDVYTSKFGFSDSLVKYFTLKNMACQVIFSDSLSVTPGSVNGIHDMYKRSNINYDEYNMNDGKPYTFGDFIVG